MRSALVGLFATLVLVTSACSSDSSSETTSPAVSETTVSSAPDTTAPVSVESTTAAPSDTTIAPVFETSTSSSPAVADDCVVVPANVPTFELKITDNGVLYNDAPVPACVRASASQALSVVNNAEGDANIMLGSVAIELFAGNTAGDVVSTYGEVGESFDVYVTELDTTVIVQVAPDA